MVSGKDGWQRWMFSTDEGMLFERVPFGHRPEKDAIAGREESLWLMGQTDDERKDSGQAKSMPLDANLPGAVWYGSGKKGANLAGYAVFSPATAATVKAGNWSKGELSVVSLASQDADLRVMLKESKNFGDPQAELAAFAQELPKLSLDLDKTSFVLPLDAEGLGLDAGKRAFIERLLASAPALEATSAEAKPAAEKLRSALENYDRAMSFLKAAKTDSERLKAEVPAVLARGALEDNIDPLAKIWADAGGVESPAGTTLAAPTAGTPVPPDARYSTEAPAYGPETTKWLGEKSPGKKLSVLVLYGGVDFWEQHGRKLVELKRALNLDMEYAMAYQSDTMSSRVDEQRIRQLLASRRWDVILDWNVQSMHGPADNINILPPDIRASIYRAVMDDGTGLLLLSGKTAQEFLKADRLQPAAGQKTFAGLTLTGRVPRQSKAGGKVTPLEAEQKFADTYFGLYKAGRGLALAVDPRMGQSVSVSETPGTLYVSEMVPWGPRNKVDGDYFHAEMARMLLLAAGREPDVTFTKAPPLLSAAPGTTASLREAWGIRCKDGVKGLKATVRLRGLDGKVISEKTQEVALKNGEGEIPLTLPDLGAGTYYADLFLDSPRGRENFGYAAVLVPDAAKTSLRLEPALAAPLDSTRLLDYWSEAIKPGDPITGSVTVTNPPNGNAAKQVRISLVDEFDRVLATQTSDLPADGVISFSLPTKDIDRIPLRVEAQSLGADGCVLGDDMAEFCLRHTNRDRFQVSLVGSSTDPWWLWTHRDIWQQGGTMLPGGFTAARANMGASLFSGMGTLRGTFRGQAYGVPALPGAQPTKPGLPLSLTTLYRMGWDEATGVRTLPPAPWNDPQAFEEVLDLTQHVWDKTRRFPTPVSTLYDEGSNICADTSEPGMKAWQEWLRSEYKGDIAALNREWNSQFAKFEEITQTTGQMNKELRGDPFESAAMTAGNFARWMDRRVFANQNYANLILDGYTRRARKTDPDARIGLSGTFGFHNFGADYDVWLKKSGFWTPYAAPRGGDGLVMDLIRSNRPEDYMYSYWIGYNNGTQLPLIWDMVFKGANAVWWFQMSGDGTYGWLGRNDVPYAVRQTMIDQAILPLRRGLGDLLIRLKALSDPIALYYSPQVALASGTSFIPEMKGPGIGNEFAGAGSSAAGAIDLIRDNQREFLYLTKKRVLDGDLKKLGTRLLFLPMVQPLGEDDVAALRAFAEAGGIVVADLRPGVLSGRGRPVTESPVDKLFGIKRTGPGKAQEINFTGPVQVGGRSVNLTLEKAKADAEIAPAGASVGATADGVPLVLFNKMGKGGFCLLNFGFDRYAAVRKDAAAGTAWRDLFAALGMAAALPPPMADVKDKTGANPLCRLNVWEKGGLKLYGMLDGDGSGSITLPQAAWLFDLRRGPLGKTDKAPIDLFAADTPQFIAAYAFDPGDPVVKSSAAGAKAGESVRFDLSMAGSPAGDETIFSYHTRLLNPKGEWVDVIPWSAQGTAGKAAVVWRVAENDPAGQWTLEVREITTGRTTKSTINKE